LFTNLLIITGCLITLFYLLIYAGAPCRGVWPCLLLLLLGYQCKDWQVSLPYMWDFSYILS
jgi:hypothetical protein